MEAVIFVGLQASGKSTFYRERFFDSHIRLNLDMLRTRHREALLLKACLEAKQPFVVDNTNPTPADRQRYIVPAREQRFRVVGYYFRSQIDECQKRNEGREGHRAIPVAALLGTYRKLEIPHLEEGFNELKYVTIVPGGGFAVKEWSDEV